MTETTIAMLKRENETISRLIDRLGRVRNAFEYGDMFFAIGKAKAYLRSPNISSGLN